MEKCFVFECDPAVDVECPEDVDARVSYYKLIEKKASALPICNESDSDCQQIACQAGEDCKEFLCDEIDKAEDEQCNNPEEYLKNNQGIEDVDGDDDAVISQEGAVIESQVQNNLEVDN